MRRFARSLFFSFFVILLAAGVVPSHAADCRKTGEVCVEGPSTKQINGYAITRDCWKYEDTYECREENAIDYCQPLVAAGCAKNGSTCSAYDWQGTCLYFTNTFRCGNSQAPVTGIVKLDDTYTVSVDKIDRSQCDSLSGNSSCTQAAPETCTEGPGTRNINGVDVYQDCWAWKRTYTCSADHYMNYCAPLVSSGCVQVGTANCTGTNTLGECMEKEYTYSCDNKIGGPLPTNVVYLDSSYTIVTDGADTSACTIYDSNPNCAKSNTICIEGAGTRNVNGMDVYKDCWKWEAEYACGSDTMQSNCDEYAKDPKCTLMPGSECVDTRPNGMCDLITHTYRCAVTDDTTSTVVDCSQNSFCIDGSCFNTSYPPDTDMAKVLAGMEAVREAGFYDLFRGEADECSRGFVGIGNCCKSSTKGGNYSDSSVISASLTFGGEYLKTYGSPYLYTSLMEFGNFVGLDAISQMGSEGFKYLTNDFSFYGLKFVVGDGGELIFAGFDPYSLGVSVAMYVITQAIQDLMACSQDEMVLAMKKGQNLCHLVGTYCAHKVLGSCVEKKESYCCFPSRLARIINEQGRAQIGKGWGSGKSPNCGGFTTEQLQNLRFDQMNLSEFTNEIMRNITSKTGDFATERLMQQMQNYYTKP